MAFTIPNEHEALDPSQAELHSVDVRQLVAGIAGNGVVSGCEVTAHAAANTVTVAPGEVRIDGVALSVAGANVTVTSDVTDPRYTLIVLYEVGGVAVPYTVAGTAQENPVKPDPGESFVVLAEVWVPASMTLVSSSFITDKRIFVERSLRRWAAVSDFLDPGEEWLTEIDMAPSFRILRAYTSVSARVRLYATEAQRLADLDRSADTDPVGNHGLILELVTTMDNPDWMLNPQVDGSSMESTPSRFLPITVQSMYETNANVVVMIQYLATET